MSSKKQMRILPEVDSGFQHTSKMELSVKYFNRFKLLNFFTKSPILGV